MTMSAKIIPRLVVFGSRTHQRIRNGTCSAFSHSCVSLPSDTRSYTSKNNIVSSKLNDLTHQRDGEEAEVIHRQQKKSAALACSSVRQHCSSSHAKYYVVCSLASEAVDFFRLSLASLCGTAGPTTNYEFLSAICL